MYRRAASLLMIALLMTVLTATSARAGEDPPPNILFAIADDWGWPHASAYGDPVVETPAFDRLAREGVLFHHAYVTSPSCTPSRGAILTGRWHWQLEGAANLWSVFPDRFTTYAEVLARHGYTVGSTGKAWGPGRTETRGRKLAGKRFPSFDEFLAAREGDAPFCFWLGTSDPHRPYEPGSGARSGMKLDAIRLPACFPEAEEIRSDVADYYFEVQRFDRLVGRALALLEDEGELDRTIVVMTGDHGMPFPRGKCNLYDTGTRVPLAIRWGGVASPGREVTDFVSLTDLAPTFLTAAGVDVPAEMTGRGLLPILASERSGRVIEARSFVLSGKERHVPGQEAPDMGGYPCRAIRTDEFLYILNHDPERWPAGTPRYEDAAIPGAWLADCDNGPTKTYLVEHRDDDDHHRKLYDLAFAKRPGEELYDLREDPHQLENVAGEDAYEDTLLELRAKLHAELAKAGDPRATGGDGGFDEHPYLGGAPKHPEWKPRQAED